MFLIELKKALLDKKTLLLLIVIPILLFFESYQSLLKGSYFININASDIKNNIEAINKIKSIGGNTYHIWIKSFGYYMSLLVVLFVSIPYATSYLEERNNNYDIFILTRVSKNNYVFSKIFTTAITGGFVLFISQLIYYIIISMFFDNTILDPFSYYPTTSIYEELFKSNPKVVIWLQMITNFFFGMSFATFSLMISSFVRKKVSAYILPILIFIGVSIVSEHMYLDAINPRYMYIIFHSSTPLWLTYIYLIGIFILCSIIFVIKYNWRLKNGE